MRKIFRLYETSVRTRWAIRPYRARSLRLRPKSSGNCSEFLAGLSEPRRNLSYFEPGSTVPVLAVAANRDRGIESKTPPGIINPTARLFSLPNLSSYYLMKSISW